MVATTVALALGVFALANLIRLLLPVQIEPAGKLVLALLLSAAVAPFYAPDLSQGVLLGVGVFGLSTLLHGAHKLLEGAGDERRAETLSKGLRR